MTVLNKLSIQYLLKNRKRSFVTIFAVVLAGALIFSVVSLAVSAADLIDQQTIAGTGNYHAIFKNVPWYNATLVRDSEQVNKFMLSHTAGFAAIETPVSAMKPYITISECDDLYLENFPIKLAEGRLPEKVYEIVLSKRMIEAENMSYKLGDEITLSVGWRQVTPYEQFTAEGRDPDTEPYTYISKDAYETCYAANDEIIVDANPRKYKVVGICEAADDDINLRPGYRAYTKLNNAVITDGDNVDVAVLFNDKDDIYRRVIDLSYEAALPPDAYEVNEQIVNTAYTVASIIGFDRGADMSGFLNSIISVVVILILFGAVSVIYNSFAISVSERKKQHGLLKSVGATPLQLRNSVYYEAFSIAVIGIPLGILAGYIGLSLVFRALEPFFEDLLNAGIKFRVVTDPGLLIAATAFISLIIFISAVIPAIRASRITPIEAIRLSGDVKVRGRKKSRPSSRLFVRIFGFEATIALKNLRRNGRKYLTAVVSLVVSISIIIAFVTFGSYAQISAEKMFGATTYDVRVTPLDPQFNEQKDENIISFMENSDNVTAYTRVILMNTFTLNLTPSMITPQNKKDFENLPSVQAFVYCLDNDSFDRYAQSVGINPQDFKNSDAPKAVYVRKEGGYAGGIRYDGELLNISAGDSLPLELDTASGTVAVMDIGAAVDLLPVGLTTKTPEHIFVIADSVFDRVMQTYMEVNGFIVPEYYGNVIDEGVFGTEFSKLYDENENMIYYCKTERMRENAINTIINVLSLMYIVIICLIGVMNVYNTINTTLELRRREFGILKSIGMTPGGIGKMLNYECVFFSLWSLLFGVPAGIAASWYIYKAYTKIAESSFSPPVAAVAVSAAGVFILVFAVMLMFKGRIKNESVVEMIRQENI